MISQLLSHLSSLFSIDVPTLMTVLKEMMNNFLLVLFLGWVLLKHRRQIHELRKMSVQDELTGLASKKKFYADAQLAIARIERENKKSGSRAKKYVSVAFIDLDGFKAINDGNHLRGDRVLIEFARFIANRTRDSDSVARFGGDEFVILLNDSTQEEAEDFCKKMQDELTNYWFDSRKVPLQLGASVSSASTSEGFDGATEMIEKADARMQEQKVRKKLLKK